MQRNKCAKCRTDSEVEGGYATEGGELFYFCSLCMNILADMPQGNKVHLFLNDEGNTDIPNKISRNILQARLERAAGESLWK